ncbi:unnamed protein product [Prorocentrum cordatum]|uniref:Photolyase/cryptochrome alpha/beta domain-containing protein n=1 Tax=Prorocentrum cordatum TaxID=2364126 RepID=A0ABN9SJE8_9DINO|nr:unnamed protein product [Polarella glacialis]
MLHPLRFPPRAQHRRQRPGLICSSLSAKHAAAFLLRRPAMSSVDPGRVQVLSDHPPQRCARYVLLWVQQDVRASCNHAVEKAIQEANALSLPVLACYGLCERFPDANERSLCFLLEGLRDAAAALASRGVRLVCQRGAPPDVASGLAREAACVVVDRGCSWATYAQICRAWRRELVQRLPGLRVLQVETSVVVPVELASPGREPAAATLRPKLQRLLPRFLAPLRETEVQHRAAQLALSAEAEAASLDLADPGALLAGLDVDSSVPPAVGFAGGRQQAQARLEAFLPKLRSYGSGKANDPSVQDNSFLSPYLHFGHISPVELGLSVWGAAQRLDEGCKASAPAFAVPASAGGVANGAAAFLEELIVRRELARNFCHYCDSYDTFDCLPYWAQETLLQHMSDRRSHTYSFEQLERGETQDDLWNAAQWEMVVTGHMHNYMRMYWCKQLIVWVEDPRVAFRWAVRLNNKYSVDGRDENGYMGIAWCFGHHDRPFPERPVFGTVRPMTRNGLASKFNMPRYQQLVQRKCREAAKAEPRVLQLVPSAALGGAALLRLLAAPPPAADRAALDAEVATQSRSLRWQRAAASKKPIAGPPALWLVADGDGGDGAQDWHGSTDEDADKRD